MSEFTLDGKQYRANKLNAFQQFGVARRIAPLLLALAPGPNTVRALGDALAGLSDEAAEYVLTTCLTAVQRHDPEHNTWSGIWNAGGKRAMFADLNDIATLFPIVGKVIEENLANFFQGPAMSLFSAAPPTT